MATTVDSLSQEALILSPEQRMALAYRLLVSVDHVPPASADDAWDVEIAERIRRFDEGNTSTIPADEVFARLREIAPER